MKNRIPKVVKYTLTTQKELLQKHTFFYMPFTRGKPLQLGKAKVGYHPVCV